MNLLNRQLLLSLTALAITLLAVMTFAIAPMNAHADGHEAAEHADGDHGNHAHMEAGEGLAVSDISLAQAHVIMAAAMARAEEIETAMDIAIVDAGGNLKAFIRMDGAWLGSIDIAIKKAKTARYFDMPTGVIGSLSQPGGPLYGIEHSNDGLITFPGGVPITNAAGDIIGAIGVSGSSVENDHDVATAGAEAL